MVGERLVRGERNELGLGLGDQLVDELRSEGCGRQRRTHLLALAQPRVLVLGLARRRLLGRGRFGVREEGLDGDEALRARPGLGQGVLERVGERRRLRNEVVHERAAVVVDVHDRLRRERRRRERRRAGHRRAGLDLEAALAEEAADAADDALALARDHRVGAEVLPDRREDLLEVRAAIRAGLG